MALTSLTSGLVLFALSASIAFAQEKVNVAVYFESYCPDSVKFLTEQLSPVYESPLMNYLNVSLIPYGKAKTNRSESGVTFTCHHQEKECKGNKVIACVLHEKDISFTEKFKFINCTSSKVAQDKNMEEYPVNECVPGTSLKLENIQNCAGNEDGSKFLEEFGNKTNSKFGPDGLKSVPSVTFNGLFNEAENKEALGNFKKLLCSKITGTVPDECNSPAGTQKSGSSALQSAAILPLLSAVYIVSRV